MMRLLHVPVAVILVLQLHGCALIYSFDKDIDKKIDQWVEQQEFTRALNAISYIRPSHPQYSTLQRKKSAIEKQAKSFEQQQLKSANDHILKREWPLAEQILEQGLKKLPDSEALQVAQQDFSKKREAYTRNLHYQLHINKAEWLIKNRTIHKDLEKANPRDTTARRNLRQHNRDSEKLYQELLACGVDRMNIGDLELAEQCFLLADELQPGKGLQATILDIQERLAKKKKTSTDVLSEQGLRLLNQAKLRMQEGHLKKSITAYKQISVKDNKHRLVTSFKKELDSRVRENVKQNIELGRKLYSQGEIKQALAIWYDVRELDADNEYLKNHIDRAERVLDKLNRLQGGEKTITPPNVETKK